MKTFADRIIAFNGQLDFSGRLPKGIAIMNPFKNKRTLAISTAFYEKYYKDHNQRRLILGINPGRFGAGITGIPFTDPKRVIENCGLPFTGEITHEPSSVFIYEMIQAFGGPADFYRKFYISSVCPLGFTAIGKKGNPINHNYYDSRELINSVYDFILKNIQEQISFGVDREILYCFGKGKNERFIRRLNEEKNFFKKIVALEHPRYIMQYKSKNKKSYIHKYLSAFNS
jgi:hypothetical protein